MLHSFTTLFHNQMFATIPVANLLKVDLGCSSQICIPHNYLSKWQVVSSNLKRKKERLRKKKNISLTSLLLLPSLRSSGLLKPILAFTMIFIIQDSLRDGLGGGISLLTSLNFHVFALQTVLHIALSLAFLKSLLLSTYPSPLGLRLTVSSLHTLFQTQFPLLLFVDAHPCLAQDPFILSQPCLQVRLACSLCLVISFRSCVMASYILVLITLQ